MKYILSLFIVSLSFFSCFANVIPDTLSLEKKIESAYEYLHKTNEENDLAGRSDENIYVIDPDQIVLSDDNETWVYTLPKYKNSQVIQEINQRLKEFNASRQGIDTRTNKERDGLVMYALLRPSDFQAYLKSGQLSFPPRHQQITDASMKNVFTAEQFNRVVAYRNEYATSINRVRSSISAKHPLTVLYSSSVVTYFKPTTLENSSYYINYLNIDVWEQNLKELSKGRKAAITGVQKLIGKIVEKANVDELPAKFETEDDFLRAGVERVIAAIKTVVDGQTKSGSLPSTDCKQPVIWPLKTDAHAAFVKRFLDASDPVGLNKELLNVLADTAENLTTTKEKALPDKIFITEKLPDLINLMTSNYTIQVRFVQTNFFIPLEDRPNLAKEIFDANHYDPNTILIIVPYFYCHYIDTGYDGEVAYKVITSMTLMPSAYTTNAQLRGIFNQALYNPATFEVGFKQAFAAIPKLHRVYAGAFLWNGQLVFSTHDEPMAVGYSNIVDVYVLVDDRIDKLKDLKDCDEALIEANGPDDKLHPSMFNKKSQFYVDCVRKHGEEARRILMGTQATFTELNPDASNLRQGDLLDPDGGLLALTYVRAVVLKKGIKFSIAGNSETIPIEDTYIEDSYFYGNDNPVHTEHWANSIVRTVSFMMAFVGPAGILFDTSMALFYLADGNREMAMSSFESAVLNIVMPIAFEGVIKGAKLAKNAVKNSVANYKVAKAIEKDGIVNAVGGKTFWVGKGSNIMEAQVADKGLVVTKGVLNENGALVAAGVAPEAASKMPEPLKAKVTKDVIETQNSTVKSKTPMPGLTTDEVLAAVNDASVVARYADALKANPDLGFMEFLLHLKGSSTLINLSESAEAALLKPNPDFCDIVIDGVKDGKITVKGKEMTPQELASYMKNGKYSGKPVRVISVAESAAEELEKFADNLAMELDAGVTSHTNSIKINEAGEIVSAVEGASVNWGIDIDYRGIPNFNGFGEMFRPLEYAAMQHAERGFTIIPECITAEGNVLCRINGKLTMYTPRQLADEMAKAGMRADESIFVAIKENYFAKENFKNMESLCSKLNAESGNQVVFSTRESTFIRKHEMTLYDKKLPESKDLFLKTDLASFGERQVTLLSEKNYKIADAEGHVYVTIEGFTSNGKVKVYRPNYGKVDELSADEFLKELVGIEGKTVNGATIPGRNIRMIPTSGAEVVEADARQFMRELAQKTRASVETPRAPLSLPENGVIPVNAASWMTNQSVGDGIYYLMRNENKLFNQLMKDFTDEEFINQLGLALTENGGKILEKVKASDEVYKKYTKDLFEYFTKYRKISIPTYTNIENIAARLEMDLTDALKGELYNNPLYAKTLDRELMTIEKEQVEKLAGDADLLKEALQYVKTETVRNNRGLVAFMAGKNMEKVLGPDLAKSVIAKYGDNPLFINFLASEVEGKLSGSLIDQFKVYEGHLSGFLDNFEKQYVAHLQNPTGLVDIEYYMLQIQQKNQMFLAAQTEGELKTAAGKLLPQEGYFDVVLKTDGKNFIAGNEVLTPEQVAKKIAENPNWDKRSVRFVVEGDNAKDPVQKVLDKLDVDGKMHARNKVNVGDDGKVPDIWDTLNSALPKPPAPQILFQEDDALKLISSLMKKDPQYVYLYIHAYPGGFYLKLGDAAGVQISNMQVVDWAIQNEVFLKAIREGRNVKMVSCCLAASDAAKQFSKDLAERARVVGSPIEGKFPVIEAPNVRYGVNNGIEGTPEEAGGKWFAFKDGENLGPIKEKPEIPYYGSGSGVVAGAAEDSMKPVVKDNKVFIFIDDEGAQRELAHAELEDGWIMDPFIWIKKGVDGDKYAQSADVWEMLFQELKKMNGGQRPKGIKGFLMEDNYGKWQVEYKKLREAFPDEKNQLKLMRDAIWETPAGKWAKQSEYKTLADCQFLRGSIDLTFVP